MHGDGNCTTYAVISQLYPQTFGGYRLKPGRSPYEEITKNPEVMEKVEEIRKVADKSILNTDGVSDFGDEQESVGDMAKHTWMSINHASWIAAHYNRVIVVINPAETSRMTAVFLPLPGCDFTASLSQSDRDMSSYHVLLRDKFNDPKNVSVDVFVQLANDLLHGELTSDSTVMEVIRTALECSDTIRYITEGGHSRSLQMRNREGLRDYIPSVLSQTSEDSIAALGKETPLVINNNELNVSKEEEEKNENSDRAITKMEMVKYLMIIDHYKLSYNIDEFIRNKKYRQDSIKQGRLYKYLKIFHKENIGKNKQNLFNEYWEKMLGLKTKLKKPNDNRKKAKEMLKYMKLMKHYKVEYDLSEFLQNKYYREEMMKNVDTNNVITTKITKEKKADDDDKLEYDFVSESEDEQKYDDNEIEAQIEAELDGENEDDEEIVDEDDNDGNVADKSIAALDKEVPSVISNNVLSVTEKSEGVLKNN
jgi:hypothetical protein